MSSDEERVGLLDDSADSVTHFTAETLSPAGLSPLVPRGLYLQRAPSAFMCSARKRSSGSMVPGAE